MSADTHSPPKSILKTSLPSAHAASASTSVPSNNIKHGCTPQKSKGQPSHSNNGHRPIKPGSDPRHVAIALHHAHRIQSRKDAEALILDRILELVSFPSSSSADPAAPSVEDAKAFKAALRPFQPSDYDNLILERNIEGLCGYGLCPRENRKEDPKVKNRIVYGPKGSGPGGRGREMRIVPKEKLEMWCSEECAERAMYVKVQLQEQPVWERSACDGEIQDFSLLEEARSRMQKGKERIRTSDNVGEAAHQLGNLHLDQGGDNSSNMRELALERGDSNPALQAGRVDINLVEKSPVSQENVTPPRRRPEDRSGGSVEGHIPKEHREGHS